MEAHGLAAVLGALMGLVLALTGAGGGVLSVPLLVMVLGLPLAQKWVTEMEGRIQVRNVPGGGARFEISFPAAGLETAQG